MKYGTPRRAAAAIAVGLSLVCLSAHAAPSREAVARIVVDEARRQHFPPALALAVAEAESDFDPDATSSAGAGQASEERKGLGMEVAEHGIGLPSADEADDIAINTTTEEGHGSTCVKAASGSVSGSSAARTRRTCGWRARPARRAGRCSIASSATRAS